MLLVRRSANMKLVDSIVRLYWKALQDSDYDLTYNEISELLRYSMCILLNLPTQGSSRCIVEYGKYIVNYIRPEIDRLGLVNLAEDKRQGLLEACVHCVEMSRKLVVKA